MWLAQLSGITPSPLTGKGGALLALAAGIKGQFREESVQI